MSARLDIPPDEPLLSRRYVKGDPITAEDAMLLCFEIARGGLGLVSPNPLVGCVIVDASHRLLNTGFHAKFGQAHAEQNALDDLETDELQDATVYVSLEPCAHEGQTPPCARRLAKLPIARVLYAAPDPNPKVNGKGAQILNEAGVECQKYPGFENLAWQENALFFQRQEKGKRLIVGLKAAVTLDGKIARSGDQRAWISSPRSRRIAHYLRLVYDAVIVGAETLVKDNPQLTPRQTSYGDRVPWRIVLDPSLRALQCRRLADQKLLASSPERVLWITAAAEQGSVEDLRSLGVSVRFLPLDNDSRFCPGDILAELAELPIHSVMLEGGAGVYKEFLERGLVDRLHLFMSPNRLYGAEAESIYGGSKFIELNPSRRFIYPVDTDFLMDLMI